jgi:cyclopropane fatty-acyl-phospholipid synthase-like methyltransferase
MRSTIGRLSLSAVLAMSAFSPAFGQDPKFVNKMAPYVASPQHVVDLMLEMAKIKPGETVYDLGSGDGRILVEVVERYKAHAVGVEISPKLVEQADERIKKAGIADSAHVIQGDVLKTDLSNADVAIVYLSTELNASLRPRLEKYLKPGARVVSHDYPMPGWRANRIERVDGKQMHLVYLYEMPAAR